MLHYLSRCPSASGLGKEEQINKDRNKDNNNNSVGVSFNEETFIFILFCIYIFN